jgi:hypothetical protein
MTDSDSIRSSDSTETSVNRRPGSRASTGRFEASHPRTRPKNISVARRPASSSRSASKTTLPRTRTVTDRPSSATVVVNPANRASLASMKYSCFETAFGSPGRYAPCLRASA